jgi:hypothetical protein
MNSKRLTSAAVLAVIIAAGGCSDKGALTGPLGPAEKAATSTTSIPVSTPAFRQSAEARQWLSIEATVQRTEIEGGCWYLQVDKGKRYEPDLSGSDLTLATGMKLKVHGYLEPEISSICMIGPKIRIVNYQVIPSKIAVGSPVPIYGQTFIGILDQTADGCYFITTEKDQIFALDMRIDPRQSVRGSKVQIWGDWSPLPYNPCNVGPLFVVEFIKFLGLPVEQVDY